MTIMKKQQSAPSAQSQPFPEWVEDPRAHLEEPQLTFIRNKVIEVGPDVAARIYDGTCVVDQYGRQIIKEVFGITVPVILKAEGKGKKEAPPAPRPPKAAALTAPTAPKAEVRRGKKKHGARKKVAVPA